MSKTSFLKSKRAKAYGLLLLNTALWGFAPPIIKTSLKFVTTNQFLFGRYIIASIIFLPIFLLTRKKSIHLALNRHALLLVLLALLGTPLTLIPLYEGIKLTSSIEASLLYTTIPIMVVIGGWLFLNEKVVRREWIGLTIAIAGSILLVIEPLIYGRLSNGTFSALGNFLIILSNLIWTAFVLLAKKFKVKASDVSIISYLVSIPFFLTLMLLENPGALESVITTNTTAILGILFMAIFGSVIAFWAYAKGQTYIEAGEASIFTYLQPIFTLPLSILWLHEGLSFILILATIIIATGVYISEKTK